MIHSRTTAVTPERDLAYLALVSSREDETAQADAEPSTTLASSNSTDATLVDEPGFIGPALRTMPVEVETPNAPSPSSVLGKRKSESGDEIPDATAMDIDTPPHSRSIRELSRSDTDIQMAEEFATKLDTPFAVHKGKRAHTLPPEASTIQSDDAKPRSQSDGHELPAVQVAQEEAPVTGSLAPPPLPPRPPKRSLTVADQGSGSAMLFGALSP